MEYTAHDIAAIWFTVYFGACLLAPLFTSRGAQS